MEYGIDAPKYLDGMFSFVLYDKKLDRTLAARDPIGITTFYQGWASSQPNSVYFGSELKCLYPVCDRIESFPPGHIYDSMTKQRTRYYQPTWWDAARVPTTPARPDAAARDAGARGPQAADGRGAVRRAAVGRAGLQPGGVHRAARDAAAQEAGGRRQRRGRDGRRRGPGPRPSRAPKTWTAARAWWASTTTTSCRR